MLAAKKKPIIARTVGAAVVCKDDPYGPARNFGASSRTRRSDRAGKTRTALLGMRTALLATGGAKTGGAKTGGAKSMRVNDKNNFVAEKFCSLQNE